MSPFRSPQWRQRSHTDVGDVKQHRLRFRLVVITEQQRSTVLSPRLRPLCLYGPVKRRQHCRNAGNATSQILQTVHLGWDYQSRGRDKISTVQISLYQRALGIITQSESENPKAWSHLVQHQSRSGDAASFFSVLLQCPLFYISTTTDSQVVPAIWCFHGDRL